MARTPHSLAWSVLREHALRTDRRPPRLVTASERDETIAELLAGHAEDGTAPAWPGHLDERLRLTRAFRDELREMSARLVEHGVGPDGLVRFARRHGRPEWEAAAHVLTEVDQVAGLRGDEAHDPAGIVAVAADLLADRANGLAGWLAGQVSHLAVDDAQDLTPAAWSFVREVADVVGDLLVAGDPDGATQTFRGAHPGLLERTEEWLADPGAPVTRSTFTRPLRQAPLLQRVQAAVGRELHGARPPAWSPGAEAVGRPPARGRRGRGRRGHRRGARLPGPRGRGRRRRHRAAGPSPPRGPARAVVAHGRRRAQRARGGRAPTHP